MKIIEIKLYKFDELSEQSQAKAIKAHQINTNYDWWDCIEINAKECGVIVESFDTYRGDINLSFKWEANDVAHGLIHFWGAESDIGKVSQTFIDERTKLHEYHAEEFSQPQNTLEEDEDNLVDYFHGDVSNYFLKQLCDELEWIESDEYAKEYLSDMDYDFMEDGTEY
jgi:hypothetical protein